MNAQQYSQQDFIWIPTKTVSNYYDSTSFNVLAFEQASYDYADSYLPFFEEVLPLPSNDFELKISIKSTTYDSIPISSLSGVMDINNIKQSLKIQIEHQIIRKQTYGKFRIYPMRLSNSGQEILLLNSLQYEATFELKQNIQKSGHDYASNSVLANGTWHKMQVTKTGIHKITYNELSSYGLPVSSLDPAKIQIFGNGGKQLPYDNADSNPDDLIENAIFVSDGNDGSFDQGDYILFYAQGPHYWSYNQGQQRFLHHLHEYDDEAYYFITYGQQNGKRIQQDPAPASPANITTSTYDNFQYYEKDSVNLLKTGRLWFGDVFDIDTRYTYNFNFPDLATNTPVKFRTSMAGRHTSNSQFVLNINGNTQKISISAISSHYTAPYAGLSRDTFSLNLNNGDISMEVEYQKPASSAIGWMDYIEVNARENLVYRGKQLDFRDNTIIAPGNIAEYSVSSVSSGIMVWDVTDPLNPKEINAQINGNTLSFSAAADSLREFVAHKSNYYTPVHMGEVPNQNLHALSFADMIIVTHPELASQAEEIADLHRNMDKMTVHVVEPQTIYNEFSSGQKDITAIRNFMRMFYDNATQPDEMPRYLLLMGDGNYDPKNRNNYDQATIPAFQSSWSISPTSSYVTDDYFGMFDNGEGVNAQGGLDIGVGRIPVGTKKQANEAITKIRRYLNLDTAAMNADIAQNPGLVHSLQDWRNTICFVGDDEDGNLHTRQANQIADKVQNENPSYIVDKIFFDAYQQVSTPGGQRYPEATKAINQKMQKGALIMNYIGHGGEAGWAHEEVLRISDINSWNNKYNMPVFMTATCEFSRFDDPARVSAGEYVFLNPNGGAISMFTTSRIAFSGANESLNRAFYNNLFKKENGDYIRMGDLMMYAKLGASSQASLRNFVLLGDPALQFAFPEKTVITTKVNDQDTSITDTLQALSNVTIEGIITNGNGVKDSTFNGIIYPTVYDKLSIYTTLGQDNGSSPYSFKLRNNILYKGKASVKDGEFSFSFFMPKDIAYNLGEGKIMYYAENGITDANGYYENFMIGGTSDSADIDTSGPQISLYMNDFSFVSGGITDEDPILLAKIFDEHGINTVGNGIGHDIVAILDENTNQQLVLNDYYEADLDDYRSGVVRYPYQNLSEGRHTLTVKVWDVYNNSSETTIEFVVTKSQNITIRNLKAYPNPSDGKVWFTFDHNQACCDLDFKVEIFNLDGRLLQTLQTNVAPDGYSVSPLEWNGRTASGSLVGGGLYIYRATLRTESGVSKQKSGKIVILN